MAEAWKIVTERFGDAAPTQGEAIQLIGQMYTSNLLQAEIPPDSESIFQRYRKRRKREVQNTLMSFLFPRFKLFDPNRLLDRWVPLVGWLFIWKGFVAWGILILFGLHALAGNFGNLYDSSSTMLSPANLPLLYGAFVLAKAVHEAAHAFSCKFLGTFEMNSGSVHNTGIMLLLFTPAPYVDATSSWAFRNKWRRIMVSAAGIWAELALAAVAAVIWANTSDGIALHAVCHNLMFVASVSTFLFNGNPLLRYDAYFILCDFLEMPNLASRGKQYSEYLVKRYVWDVKEANHTANGIFEKFFFVAYTIASNVYRVFLLSGIVLTIADMAFFVGVVLALGSMAMWVLLPLGKFVRYLFSSPELSRVRGRAIVTTTVFIVGTALAIGGVPVRDNFLIEGVVEADNDRHIHAGCDGFLVAAAPSLAPVTGDETVVATLHNPSIETEWAVLTAREKELQANLRIAEARDPASIEVVQEQWLALL
ncbi:MAG: hypothetical protein LIQ30_02990, partial [Planctomycetes bacterium]|nr:hypothetical protein [Planctomycetota bacterium]